MSKKKKIIISVIAAVLIIAVIVSAVVIAMTKGKNAKKASGVYANKVADVMYQAGSTDKYSGVVEAANSLVSVVVVKVGAQACRCARCRVDGDEEGLHVCAVDGIDCIGGRVVCHA